MRTLSYRVKSVIFDMDGVITNTMPDHYKAWKQAMADEGVHVTHFDIYSREGQRGLQSVRELFETYDKPYCPAKAKTILEKKEEHFKRIAKKKFITGARSLLKQLYNSKIKLGLVTGTSREELFRILPEQLRNLFSVVVTGCEVQHGKPHPQPYLRSLEILGVDAQDAVVIENAPFGIQSAKAAGIPCLALETSLAREHLSGADAVFSSVKELREHVQFRLRGK